MAFTVDIDALAAPENVAAAQGASGTGNLNDGTYYVVVTALDSTSFQSWVVCSPASAEATVVCNQGNGLNSINVSWDAVAGAVAYNVFISTVSGDYAGAHRAGSSNTITTTTGTSYSITAIANMTRYAWEQIAWGDKRPGKLGLDIGRISVNFWGSGTLDDLLDAITTAGYGDYYFWDGSYLVFAGSWVLSGSNSTSWSSAVKCIHFIFLGKFDPDSNANASLEFGAVQNGMGDQYGCVFEFIRWSANNFKAGLNAKCYGCLFKNSQYSQGNSPIYASNGGTMYLSITGPNLTGTRIAGDSGARGTQSDLEFIGGYYPYSADIEDIIINNYRGDEYTALQIHKSYAPGNTYTRWIIYAESDGTGDHIRDIGGGVYGSALTFLNSWFNSATGKPNFTTARSDTWIEFKRSFNVEIATAAAAYLSGVTVDLQDKNGGYVWTQGSLTTGADGKLSSDQNVAYWSFPVGVTVIADNGPFTLTLSKTGYQTLIVPDLDLAPSTSFVDVSGFVWQGTMVEPDLPAVMFDLNSRPYKTLSGPLIMGL